MKIIPAPNSEDANLFPWASIRQSFTYSAAHQLPNHHGAESSLHGHTYRLDVTVFGQTQPDDPFGGEGDADEGMILPPSLLEGVVKDEVLDECDHAILARGDEPFVGLIALLEEHSQEKQNAEYYFGKIAVLGVRTTTANMARLFVERIAQRLAEELADRGAEGLHHWSVTVDLSDTFSSSAQVTQQLPLLYVDEGTVDQTLHAN